MCNLIYALKMEFSKKNKTSKEEKRRKKEKDKQTSNVFYLHVRDILLWAREI